MLTIQTQPLVSMISSLQGRDTMNQLTNSMCAPESLRAHLILPGTKEDFSSGFLEMVSIFGVKPEVSVPGRRGNRGSGRPGELPKVTHGAAIAGHDWSSGLPALHRALPTLRMVVAPCHLHSIHVPSTIHEGNIKGESAIATRSRNP